MGVLEDGTKIVARASICATGVAYRRLGLPNEMQFMGAGLYYGAGPSEAPLTAGEHVVIVGGGNSAGQAAMHFASYARFISIVIRGESLKSTLSHYLLQRIAAAPNIEVLPRTEVTALNESGRRDGRWTASPTTSRPISPACSRPETCAHNAVRRFASAVGEGAMAVAFVHRVLDGN